MLSLWRSLPKYLPLNAVKSTSAKQLRTATSSGVATADRAQPSLIDQLKEHSDSWNVAASDIKKVVRQWPSLMRHPPSEWDSLFITLRNIGFAGNEILSMLKKHPPLLTTDRNNIQEVWNALTLFRISSELLVDALVGKPNVLCTSPKGVEHKAHAILNFVGFKNNSLRVLNKCENIFALSLEELNKVIEYVQEEMKVRRKYEICRSRVVECPLNKLRMRHTFLVQCGLYVPQKHDIPVTIPHSNPYLSVIVNSTDEVFATKAARVTPEEFYVYQDLWEKEFHEDIYDFSDDD